MNQKYTIELRDEERERHEKITSSGIAPARMVKRAQVLLKSDCKGEERAWKYDQICAAFNVTPVTVLNIRKSFVEKGLAATLSRKKPEREYAHALDGEAEAHLIALACSEPPEGRKVWSLRLLKDRFIQLGHVDHISHETIRSVLKKNELKPWLREQWRIPPKADAAFVCNMEDVLGVYKRPLDDQRPLLCMDEMPKQLLSETREPLPVAPGKPARQDYEYQRGGVADVCMAFEPLVGKRYIEITDQRRREEWARVMQKVSDELYPQAEKIVVVMDNLNTHTPAAFYQVFEPEEARRLVERFEFHYTPKHGSWLNMAEIELSALVRQCLDRRIPDKEALIREVKAWQDQRNAEVVRVHW
uniref:IS630 family transposase n=1 Tax=Anaerolinea thermolimosa TaxID=229919 RepID=A0A7C4PJR3_9CHLR